MSDLVVVTGGVVLVGLAWVWIIWRTWRRDRRRLAQEDRAFWSQQAAQYDAVADEIETAGGDARWLRARATECHASGAERGSKR